MSRKFQREQDILDRLEEENRQLKAQVRSLSKRLKSVSRGYRKFQDEDNQDEKENIIKEAAKGINGFCWDCKIGEYNIVKVLNRQWRECTNCGKRGKTKISTS